MGWLTWSLRPLNQLKSSRERQLYVFLGGVLTGGVSSRSPWVERFGGRFSCQPLLDWLIFKACFQTLCEGGHSARTSVLAPLRRGAGAHPALGLPFPIPGGYGSQILFGIPSRGRFWQLSWAHYHNGSVFPPQEHPRCPSPGHVPHGLAVLLCPGNGDNTKSTCTALWNQLIYYKLNLQHCLLCSHIELPPPAGSFEPCQALAFTGLPQVCWTNSRDTRTRNELMALIKDSTFFYACCT